MSNAVAECYSASLERYCEHGGLLRIHAGAGGKLGDAYVWCSGCRFNHDGDPRTIYIGGFCGGLPGKGGKAGMLALRDTLLREGFRYAAWQRRNRTGIANGPHLWDIEKGFRLV